MSLSFGQELRSKLIACGLAEPSELQGCTPEEIESIRTAQGVEFLPEIYKQFLLEMGKGVGGLFLGSDYRCYSLAGMKDDCNRDLEDLGINFRLPKDAYVFLNHGGYAYWYFLTKDRDENPAVHLYEEETETARKLSENLSSFFDECIRELAPAAFEEYQRRLESRSNNEI